MKKVITARVEMQKDKVEEPEDLRVLPEVVEASQTVYPFPTPSLFKDVLMTSREESVSVKWKIFDKDFVGMMSEFRKRGDFVDATLWCQGQTIQAHKIVLATSSLEFYDLFRDQQLVRMKIPSELVCMSADYPFVELSSIVDFMYEGEVSVPMERMESFLATARKLRMKGMESLSVANVVNSNPYELMIETETDPILSRAEVVRKALTARKLRSDGTQSSAASPLSLLNRFAPALIEYGPTSPPPPPPSSAECEDEIEIRAVDVPTTVAAPTTTPVTVTTTRTEKTSKIQAVRTVTTVDISEGEEEECEVGRIESPVSMSVLSLSESETSSASPSSSSSSSATPSPVPVSKPKPKARVTRRRGKKSLNLPPKRRTTKPNSYGSSSTRPRLPPARNTDSDSSAVRSVDKQYTSGKAYTIQFQRSAVVSPVARGSSAEARKNDEQLCSPPEQTSIVRLVQYFRSPSQDRVATAAVAKTQSQLPNNVTVAKTSSQIQNGINNLKRSSGQIPTVVIAGRPGTGKEKEDSDSSTGPEPKRSKNEIAANRESSVKLQQLQRKDAQNRKETQPIGRPPVRNIRKTPPPPSRRPLNNRNAKNNNKNKNKKNKNVNMSEGRNTRASDPATRRTKSLRPRRPANQMQNIKIKEER